MPGIWYIDATGTSSGPVGFDRARDLITAGAIATSTLVWLEGMADWAPADQVAALRDLFPPAPPARPSGPRQSEAVAARAAIAPVEDSSLTSELRTWGCFWRAILNAIGNGLIVPAPWTGPLIYRYIGETTKLPDGRRFGFDGKAGDIWWVFVLQGLLLWAGQVHNGEIVALPASAALDYLIIQWFCAKLRPPEGIAPLAFKGGFWKNLGWSAFCSLSVLTIIGWAWVGAAYYRWLCRNVDGGLAFEFRGSGLSILWRFWLAIFACCFVIPIPWVIAWMARWTISQIHVAVRSA